MTQTTIRDRLKKKLEDKKKQSSVTSKKKQVEPIIAYNKEEDKLIVLEIPKFYMILTQNETFREKALSNEYFDTSERYRLEHIQKMVAHQSAECKKMTSEQLSARKREIVIALHDKWFDSFLYSCSEIEYSDRPEFNDARFFSFCGHTIIALDIKVDKPQMKVDYLCLNFLRWFHHNEVHDDGRDIIISKDSLQLFFCSIIGYDFYHTILKDEFMMSLTPDFCEKDIVIVSKTLGNVYLPTLDAMREAFWNYPHMLSHWKQLANPFSF